MSTGQNGKANTGNGVVTLDPAEQLRKETEISDRDFYAVYDRRHGKRLIPSARVYNNWAKEAGIKTRIIEAGCDADKAWAHVKGWIGPEANPVLQREARVTIVWKTECEDLIWNAIAPKTDHKGQVVKAGKPYTIGLDGYPVLTEPNDQLAIIQQLSRLKRFGERTTVTKAEAIVEKKLLGVEYRESEEITHEQRETEAVAAANGETVQEAAGSTAERKPPAGNGAAAPMGDPPRPGSQPLNTVVEINGKRLRTAGIQADQLEAIWAAAERLGKGPVAEVLKAFGVEKSVHLSREKAGQVLAKLNERLSRLR
ncbi:MAG: hypothetical protein HY207_01700 [Nitrospirae bacterium]|nr:hypothetical protein [Nitrospirota bacterium]